VLAAVLVATLIGHAAGLRWLARALIVEDAPRSADAIVVVAGGIPAREATAASLYRQGLAPRVVVSNQRTPERVRELMSLGIRSHDFQTEARLVLERHGVPSRALVLLSEPVDITEAELRLVGVAAQARGWRRVILVTSPQHSRRVKLVWERGAGLGVEGLVTVTQQDDFPVDGWWRRRRQAEAVLHEYLGLAAIYLGVSRYLD
jgi:uncharacterized SAM-binding protein YcdF (DUF218 family)